jgi:FixJ family two-component response regulator
MPACLCEMHKDAGLAARTMRSRQVTMADCGEARPGRSGVSKLARCIGEDDLLLIMLFAEGLPIDVIARRLDLSERTVRRRARAICDRVGARATIQVVAWAAREGLI